MTNKLVTMIQMQNELNIQTCGKKWGRGISSNGKTINWDRAIKMELFELIDSTPWKHWKDINAESDFDNITIELVDIWHFILSKMLATGESTIQISSIIQKTYNKVQKTTINTIKPTNLDEAIVLKCEEIIALTPPTEIEELLTLFFELSILVNVDINLLSNIYFGKNTLNEFRQQNGYKSGNYKKIWNGKEDNMIMINIIRSNKDLTKEQLIKYLNKEYKDVA